MTPCVWGCGGVLLQVPAEPDGRKMSPAQFSYNVVPPVKQITDLYWVVTTCNTNGTTWS